MLEIISICALAPFGIFGAIVSSAMLVALVKMLFGKK